MKNKIFIILLICLISVGCARVDKASKDVLEKQQKVIQTIGKSNKEKLVIKIKDKKKDSSYYVYQFNSINYTQFLYTLHNTKKSFDASIEKYKNNAYYALKKDEESYVTIVTLQKGTDSYETVKKEYNNKKRYEIIE